MSIALAGGGKLAAGSYVWVLNTEEKGSDVNLATLLLGNAAAKRCEMSVVVSNDSDLELPIKTCCLDLHHPVGVLSTQPSNSLAFEERSDVLQGDPQWRASSQSVRRRHQ